MSSEGSITQLIERLKTGDELAAEELWNAYFSRLAAFARQKLGSLPRRTFDEEDVALSALDSVYRGARQGRFPKLRDRDNLWSLLIVVTSNKVADHFEREQTQKRGGGRVRGESFFNDGSGDSRERGIEQVLATTPTPEFVVQVAQECDRLLTTLEEESLKTMASLKLQGHTNEEIGEHLECSLRTVERKLAIIRTLWSKDGDTDG